MLFPAGSVPPGPPINTKKALLLLDFQNDFVSAEGKLPVANVSSFLPDLIPLVAAFRAKGEVIWVGTEYKQPRSTISASTGSHSILIKHSLTPEDPSDETHPLSPSRQPDVTHDREAFLAPVMTATKYRCCIPGTQGADYPDCIKDAIDPQQDLVMLKSHYSAFAESSLLTHLRTRLITELYVCGSLSNIAVYATVLDAVCHGLQVTVVEDCLGFNDEKCHIEAMRQMADQMGANGIDCQELRDDLAGLLGDVVREQDYATKFQVSLPPPAQRNKSHTSKKQIHDWIAWTEGDGDGDILAEGRGTPSTQGAAVADDGHDSFTKSESPQKPVRALSLGTSPPRKRSTSDVDSLKEALIARTSHVPAIRRASTAGACAEQIRRKQNKSSIRKKRPSDESSKKLPSSPDQTFIISTQPTNKPGAETPVSSDNARCQGEEIITHMTRNVRRPLSGKRGHKSPGIIGPDDTLGQGDCRLYVDLIDPEEAERAFYSCRESVKWQKMFHRSGQVPRLVAVQGTVAQDGSIIPIYRHPADESPELLAFDPTVNHLRLAAEKAVGHPLNHVLIQLYRNGEDNISEHSDKTLDVVHGSSIVNLSLGAQRTMVLRMKRSAVVSGHENVVSDTMRPSQRIPLPHNSLFVLGQESNQYWLHAIRADKRPSSQKEPAELAFAGERISLTFRHIGTFINSIARTIWGQGATSKTREGAKRLLTGIEAEEAQEAMIRAFGQENHRSTDWNWDEWYGRGFDVVSFETRKA